MLQFLVRNMQGTVRGLSRGPWDTIQEKGGRRET